MGYGSKQVNVGSLINPTEGISRSLTDLSNMYGRQAAAKSAQEQAEATKAENNRRWNAQQAGKEAASALQKEKSDALTAGNKFYLDAQEGRNINLSRGEHTRDIQNLIKSTEAGWDKEKSVYKDYLYGGNEQKLSTGLDKYFASKKKGDETKVVASRNLRKNALANVRGEMLAATPGAERDAIYNAAMEDVFGGRKAALDKNIATGSFLTNNQRANALVARLPESFVKHGNVANMHSKLLATMSGNTKAGLLSDEKARVSGVNKGIKDAYDSKVSAYNAEMKRRKANVNWKVLSKAKQEDIGSWDNADRDNIVGLMVAAGIPHDQIAYEIGNLIERNVLGASIPSPKDDVVIERINKIKDDMKAAGTSLDAMPKLPEKVTYENARKLEEIQRSMFSDSNAKAKSAITWKPSWGDYRKKIEAVAATESAPTTEILNVPDLLRRATPSAVNEGVPENTGTHTPANRVVRNSPNSRLPYAAALAYDPKGSIFVNAGRFANNVVSDVSNAGTLVRNTLADLADSEAFKNTSASMRNSDVVRATGNNRKLLNSQAAGINKRNEKITAQAVADFNRELASTPSKTRSSIPKTEPRVDAAREAAEIRKAQDRVASIQGTPKNSTVERRNMLEVDTSFSPEKAADKVSEKPTWNSSKQRKLDRLDKILTKDTLSPTQNKQRRKLQTERSSYKDDYSGGPKRLTPTAYGKLDTKTAKADYDALNSKSTEYTADNKEPKEDKLKRAALGMLLDGKKISDIADGPLKEELAKYMRLMEEKYYG